MKQCIVKRKQPSLAPVNKDIFTAGPHHCLALCQSQLGNAADAEKSFQEGLRETGHGVSLRLDYARFLFQQNRPLDALNRLHEAVTENSQSAAAWRLGGHIALSQPQYLEFACDWTGEAVRYVPDDPLLAAQRAEALLLSQDTAAAREIWQQVSTKTQEPRALAALILCEIMQGRDVGSAGNEAETRATTRAFIEWYRKLVAFKAHQTIVGLHERTQPLRQILPEAARLIESVIADACRAETPEPCAA